MFSISFDQSHFVMRPAKPQADFAHERLSQICLRSEVRTAHAWLMSLWFSMPFGCRRLTRRPREIDLSSVLSSFFAL